MVDEHIDRHRRAGGKGFRVSHVVLFRGSGMSWKYGSGHCGFVQWVDWCSGMDGYGMDGYGERWCTMRSAYLLLLTLYLLYSRYISFRVTVSFSPAHPLYIYSYEPTPGLHRIDIGVFLAQYLLRALLII